MKSILVVSLSILFLILFIHPVFSTIPTVTHTYIKPLKGNYFSSDLITIYGTWNRPNTNLAVELRDPFDNLVNSTQITVTNDTNFTTALQIPFNATKGLFSIYVKDNVTTSQKLIHVNLPVNTILPNIPLTVYPIDSPLKQLRDGVSLNNVKCNEHFQLVIKNDDKSPACIKPDDIIKLLNRGWVSKNNPPVRIYCMECSGLDKYGYTCYHELTNTGCYLPPSQIPLNKRV